MAKIEKKSSESKTGKTFCYVVGSVVLCTAACAVIPMVVPYIAGIINKNVNKISNAKKSEDDWGPVIEKKHSVERGNKYAN